MNYAVTEQKHDVKVASLTKLLMGSYNGHISRILDGKSEKDLFHTLDIYIFSNCPPESFLSSHQLIGF
jgi:hypothetical protein